MVLDLLKQHRKVVFWILFVIAVLLLVYKCGRDTAKKEIQYKEKIVYKDSIKVVQGETKVIEKEVIKYKDKVKDLKEKAKEIKYDTICNEIVAYKDSIINTQDTIIIKKDSIIYLDRKVIEFQDKIINIAPKPKRWGIGLQGGYGANKDGLSPFVGVGISYDIFTF